MAERLKHTEALLQRSKDKVMESKSDLEQTKVFGNKQELLE